MRLWEALCKEGFLQVEKEPLLQCSWGCKCHNHDGKQHGSASNIKNITAVGSSNSTSECMPTGNKITLLKRHLRSHVHWGITVHNNQDIENSLSVISECLDKENGVYIYKRILFSL